MAPEGSGMLVGKNCCKRLGSCNPRLEAISPVAICCAGVLYPGSKLPSKVLGNGVLGITGGGMAEFPYM